MTEVPLDKILRSWSKQTLNMVDGHDYSQARLEEIVNCPSLYSENSKGVFYTADKLIELDARDARNVMALDLMECMKHTVASDKHQDALVDVIYNLSSKLTKNIVTKIGLNEYAVNCYNTVRKRRNNYFNIVNEDPDNESEKAFEIFKVI